MPIPIIRAPMPWTGYQKRSYRTTSPKTRAMLRQHTFDLSPLEAGSQEQFRYLRIVLDTVEPYRRAVHSVEVSAKTEPLSSPPTSMACLTWSTTRSKRRPSRRPSSHLCHAGLFEGLISRAAIARKNSSMPTFSRAWKSGGQEARTQRDPHDALPCCSGPGSCRRSGCGGWGRARGNCCGLPPAVY